MYFLEIPPSVIFVFVVVAYKLIGLETPSSITWFVILWVIPSQQAITENDSHLHSLD